MEAKIKQRHGGMQPEIQNTITKTSYADNKQLNDMNLYMKTELDWLEPNFPVSENSSCREVQTIHLG